MSTPTKARPGDARQEEMRRLHKQIDDSLAEMRARTDQEWARAQDAITNLVRLQVAQGLAPAFLERRTPYKDEPRLRALVDEGLLHHAAFIQKTPEMLRFYQRVMLSLAEPPRAILEIGVKGGGSTAFWKAVFPDATVVGLDIKLRRWVRDETTPDGVIYLQADQTDVPRLEAIADEHGPFDIVIDDGSHVTTHQATTLRALLPRVRPGGLYIVEDVHTGAKKPEGGRGIDYGEDIWPDFTRAVFERLRHGPTPPKTTGSRLAMQLLPHIEELVLASRVLAIRVASGTTNGSS